MILWKDSQMRVTQKFQRPEEKALEMLNKIIDIYKNCD